MYQTVGYFHLIQSQQITNLKHRLSGWTTVNKNGNFSFVRVKNAWFSKFSLQMPTHQNKRKSDKMTRWRRYSTLFVTTLFYRVYLSSNNINRQIDTNLLTL